MIHCRTCTDENILLLWWGPLYHYLASEGEEEGRVRKRGRSGRKRRGGGKGGEDKV